MSLNEHESQTEEKIISKDELDKRKKPIEELKERIMSQLPDEGDPNKPHNLDQSAVPPALNRRNRGKVVPPPMMNIVFKGGPPPEERTKFNPYRDIAYNHKDTIASGLARFMAVSNEVDMVRDWSLF